MASPAPFHSKNKEFLTPKEAADYIGVHLNTFYCWIRERKKDGPPVRKFSSTCYRLPRDRFLEWANGKNGE